MRLRSMQLALYGLHAGHRCRAEVLLRSMFSDVSQLPLDHLHRWEVLN